MDDLVKPRGAPRPRRQNVPIEALGEDPATGQLRITEESSGQQHKVDRPSGHGQLGQPAAISAMDALGTHVRLRTR